MAQDTHQRLRKAARDLLGRVYGRGVTVLPDDRWIVSYPKSGNTWTRFLIGNLVWGDSAVDFVNVQARVPDIYMASDAQLLRCARPRLLKSHEYFDPRYRRVIYIVRDPRDVVLSYYHYQIKFRLIAEDYPLDAFAARFIAGDLDPYGSWGEHVGSWLGARGKSETLLLIRYEDLMTQLRPELEKIARFLGLDPTAEQIETAMRRSSASAMRQLETDAERQPRWLKTSRQDRFFVRTPRVGRWQTELPPSAAEAIVTAWEEQMQCCGYAVADHAAA